MTERQVRILRTLETSGFASVSNLSKSLSVSEMTIRRDLTLLEEEDKIRRVHGGAVPLLTSVDEPLFSKRATDALRAKQTIARLAADLVVDGETIALDVGSTALELAKLLVDRTLTVITPSVQVLNAFIGHATVTAFCPGGVMRASEGSLVGSITHEIIERFNVDKFFVGVSGFDVERGITDYSIEDATVKQRFAEKAKQTIGLVDASKFGKTMFATVGEIDMLDLLVTDQPVSRITRQVIAERGVGLLEPGVGDGRLLDDASPGSGLSRGAVGTDAVR